MALKDVMGQGAALKMLTGAMRRGRMASSYLFAGEQGVGKKMTAVNLAKALNCLSPVEAAGHADSCDRCGSCTRIDSGSHPDFLALGPEAGLIKVGQIRAVEEFLCLKAHEARVRAVVVDDAETMNISAANAFLKTLEEPAPGTIIILVSSMPETLPATIRSRCSRVAFKPLPAGAAAEVIRARAGKKKAAEALALASLSMGRPGLALGEDLLKHRTRFMNALQKMREGEAKPVWRDRQDMQAWFDMALMVVRDLAVIRLGAGDERLINADIAPELHAAGVGKPLEVIIECYEKLLLVRNSLGFNLNKGITWNYAGSLMGELLSDV